MTRHALNSASRAVLNEVMGDTSVKWHHRLRGRQTGKVMAFMIHDDMVTPHQENPPTRRIKIPRGWASS